MKNATLAGLSLVCCLLLACSGGKSGKEVEVKELDTGVQKTTKISALSEPEFKKVCEAKEAYRAEIFDEDAKRKFICQLGGMFGASMAPEEQKAAACQAGFKKCMESPVDKQLERMREQNACKNKEDSFPANCEASVKQYEACEKEGIEQALKFTKEFDCNNIAASEAILKAKGPACEAYTAVCSRVKEEDGASSSPEDAEDAEDAEDGAATPDADAAGSADGESAGAGGSTDGSME